MDFVVLESQYAKAIPTIGQWVAHGIPDKRAHLIYDDGNASGNRVLIYSWQQQYPNITRTSSSDRHQRPYVAPKTVRVSSR